MSAPKKGFAQFLRQPPTGEVAPSIPSSEAAEIPTNTTTGGGASPPRLAVVGVQGEAPTTGTQDRIRHVTSTGRVRTHSANRALPGVTLRLTEERWEKLKMLSIQERRPIQDILGEAMDGLMRSKGLPW